MSFPSTNAAEVYDGASNRQKIVTALVGAFVIRVVAGITVNRKTKRADASDVIGAIYEADIPSWIVIAAILMIASDFEATSRLSLAFTLLLLVAVIMADGERAIKNVEKLRNQPPAKTKAKNKTKKEAK